MQRSDQWKPEKRATVQVERRSDKTEAEPSHQPQMSGSLIKKREAERFTVAKQLI